MALANKTLRKLNFDYMQLVHIEMQLDAKKKSFAVGARTQSNIPSDIIPIENSVQ